MRKHFSGYSQAETAAFLKQTGLLLEAGLPLSKVLELLEEKYPHLSLGRVIGEIEAGKSFSQAVSSLKVSQPVVNQISAGEENGSLGSSLRQAAANIEKGLAFRRELFRSLMYPAAVFGLSLLLLLGLIFVILPSFSQLFSDNNLPLPLLTRILIDLPNYSWLMAGGLLAGFLLLLKTGKDDRAKIKFAIYRDLQLAGFLNALGQQIKGATPILRALAGSDGVCDNNYRKAARSVYQRVENGESLSQAFSRFPALFPRNVCQLLSVGEESGKLGEMLLAAAEFYQNEAEARLKNILAVIEPASTLLVGGVVGVVALAMMLPLFSMINSLL